MLANKIGYLAVALATLVMAGACGSSDAKAEGEQCFASSECATGLTCDFGVSPAVCRPSQTTRPDATPAPIDASPVDADPSAPDAMPVPDARPVPDAAPGTPDAGAPDAALPDAAPPDAALPDAALPDAALPDAGA